MLGGFIIHPKTAYAPHVDKDYLIALQEYAVLPNSSIPNSMNMEFNWLTFNGKAGPASTPLVIRQGERVRVRFINMGMDHHPIHLHGFTFWETGREGARQQESAWTRGNTTLVGVAQARDFEFVADRLGDWMLHCHLPHHMMNQMSSNVGPMTRVGRGMQAGASMEEGMGMLRDGNATSENRAPSLGRGLGVGSTTETLMTQWPLVAKRGEQSHGQYARNGSFEDAGNGSRRHARHERNEHAETAGERGQSAAVPARRLHGRSHDGDGQGRCETGDRRLAGRAGAVLSAA